MKNRVLFKRGEAKTLTMTLKVDGAPWSIPALTEFFLGVKAAKADTSYLFSHINADFTVVNQAGGVISVFLTQDDLDQNPATYVGELQAETPDGTIARSLDLAITIQEAVIPVP